ncbi:MAG: hypothetical protein OEY49_13005, partial [Candidatus Heimdallarchaeota archaeon]|nr:hypothetical protein [Candidatus Heimdallarchaeota archaeon]
IVEAETTQVTQNFFGIVTYGSFEINTEYEAIKLKISNLKLTLDNTDILYYDITLGVYFKEIVSEGTYNEGTLYTISNGDEFKLRQQLLEGTWNISLELKLIHVMDETGNNLGEYYYYTSSFEVTYTLEYEVENRIIPTIFFISSPLIGMIVLELHVRYKLLKNK